MRMILCADINWAIGKANQLLYHIPHDMQRFKELTMGQAVVMGRRTWDSLPCRSSVHGRTKACSKALQGRLNIVLTRRPELIMRHGDAIESLHSYAKDHTALAICEGIDTMQQVLDEYGIGTDSVWVIGGARIYRLLMPFCSEAYVTRVLAADDGADCFMADLDNDKGWVLYENGIHHQWQELSYRFDVYKSVD